MCKIEGCNNEKILAKGLCNKHYKQIYRHGRIIETIHDRNKWRAYITVNKKQISLGLFNKKEDAIKARKEGELKYFGEFAPINNERKETGGYI